MVAIFGIDYNSSEFIKVIKWKRVISFVYQLGCCGSRGPQDFLYSSWNNHSTDDLFVPSSCCITSAATEATLRPGDNYLCQLEAVRFNDNINGENHEEDDYNEEDPISNIFTKVRTR